MEITRKINEPITIPLKNQKANESKFDKRYKVWKRIPAGVKNFCSNACYESELQERIKEVGDDDTPHTKNSSEYFTILKKSILSWISHRFFVVRL